MKIENELVGSGKGRGWVAPGRAWRAVNCRDAVLHSASSAQPPPRRRWDKRERGAVAPSMVKRERGAAAPSMGKRERGATVSMATRRPL
jgi:hypothetical protein